MNSTISSQNIMRFAFSGVAIVLFLCALYFGAYLPLAKSQRYIDANQHLSSVHSLQEFEDDYNTVLNFYSPVGDEEVGKFLGQDIVSIIANPQQGEDISRALINYIEPHLIKNNERHLLLAAQMYYVMWKKYKHEDDFKKAASYYDMALAIGPKLPPALYAALSLYGDHGDKEKVREIAQTILQYWPDENRVRLILNSIH